MSWRYFSFLLWLSCLLVCGILLFSKCILLSHKITVITKSSCVENLSCSMYQNISEESPKNNMQLYLDCVERDQLKLRINQRLSSCYKSEKKVILIVIDALQYDFAYYNRSLKEEELLPFQNRLKIFDELLTTVPNNSLMFKFMANPLTNKIKQVESLTTGSLPTFADTNSNFAASEVEEDNLLDQLLNLNRKIVFMGDDTWARLYPNRFMRQYAYPSFNGWDLDTVDKGILNHLKPEILKNDWTLLIAHFLGVDHCGYKYGPFHPEMTRKLNQMNDVIRNVVDTIDHDTVLFVIGNHGMTYTDDHGGGSLDKISPALFIYSSVPFVSSDIVIQSDVVPQVDIVPTLSAILGVPIPFPNLGKIILKALPAFSLDGEASSESAIRYALDLLLINIEKMTHYIIEYRKRDGVFSKQDIKFFSKMFDILRKQLKFTTDFESFKLFQNHSFEFLNFLRELRENVWVKIDSFALPEALVRMFLLIPLSFLIIEGIPRNRLIAILEDGFLWFAYGIIFISVGGNAVLQYYEVVDDMFLSIYVSILTLSLFAMCIIVVGNWEEIISFFALRGAGRWELFFYFFLFFFIYFFLFFYFYSILISSSSKGVFNS